MTQEMRSHIGRDQLLPGRCQSILEDVVDDLAVLKWPMRCPVRDESCPATRFTTLITKISAQSFAYFGRYRHAIMELPFAAHQQLTGTPINIIKLDRDDLDCSEPESRHEEQHSIISCAMPRVATHRGENSLNPIWRQMPGQPRIPALCRLRKTQGKVARGFPTPKQILEEGPKVGCGRDMSMRRFVCQQVLDEADCVGGPKAFQVNHSVSKVMNEEPLSRMRHCVYGAWPQATLLDKVGLKVRQQRCPSDLGFGQRHRLHHANVDKMLGKSPGEVMKADCSVFASNFCPGQLIRKVRSQCRRGDAGRIHQSAQPSREDLVGFYRRLLVVEGGEALCERAHIGLDAAIQVFGFIHFAQWFLSVHDNAESPHGRSQSNRPSAKAMRHNPCFGIMGLMPIRHKTHATGHSSRLDREGITQPAKFGSERYSKEELIAELGAAFLSNEAGILTSLQFENSSAYLGSWIQKFQNDPRMIVSAASQAQRSADFVLGIEHKETLNEVQMDSEPILAPSISEPDLAISGVSRHGRSPARNMIPTRVREGTAGIRQMGLGL